MRQTIFARCDTCRLLTNEFERPDFGIILCDSCVAKYPLHTCMYCGGDFAGRGVECTPCVEKNGDAAWSKGYKSLALLQALTPDPCNP